MKKILLVVVGLLLIAGMVLVGTSCANGGKTGNSLNTNPSFLRYGTLQGKIMDAITGEAIGGDDLELYLIEGTDRHKPDKLVKDIEDTFVGEYAFTKVPVGIDSGNLSFRLVVIKDGYQYREFNISITADLICGCSYDNDEIDNTFTNEMFHRIGNIYLWPLDSYAGDVTVYVYDPQGMPLENANVHLQQNISNNTAIADTCNALYPTCGIYPSLAGTSDSSGKVTFSGDDLVLGGNYNVVVEALTTADGQQLATATGSNFTVGTDNTTRVMNMGVVTGAQVLFATSASNQMPGSIDEDGTLKITFNQPIIVDTTLFTVSESSDGVLSSSTAIANLSDDNMTLTLKVPGWTTVPTSEGATVTYTYNGGYILLKNSQTSSYRTLNGGWYDVINININQAVNRTVLMISN